MYINYRRDMPCVHCGITISHGDEFKEVGKRPVCLPCADKYYNCCSRYDRYLHDAEDCDCTWRLRAREIKAEREAVAAHQLPANNIQ